METEVFPSHNTFTKSHRIFIPGLQSVPQHEAHRADQTYIYTRLLGSRHEEMSDPKQQKTNLTRVTKLSSQSSPRNTVPFGSKESCFRKFHLKCETQATTTVHGCSECLERCGLIDKCSRHKYIWQALKRRLTNQVQGSLEFKELVWWL